MRGRDPLERPKPTRVAFVVVSYSRLLQVDGLARENERKSSVETDLS